MKHPQTSLRAGSRAASHTKAFTLVELLTVMVIIAILMSILFPVITMINRVSKETIAKNDIRQIATALNNFQTENGAYPLIDSSAPGDVTYVSEEDNAKLMNILRGIDIEKNPKRHPYLDGIRDAKNPAAPANGISPAGAWMDPWGQPYAVSIDANYDNQLPNPKPGGNPTMHRGIATWSTGYKGDIQQSGLLSWE